MLICIHGISINNKSNMYSYIPLDRVLYDTHKNTNIFPFFSLLSKETSERANAKVASLLFGVYPSLDFNYHQAFLFLLLKFSLCTK